jgi:hypothetical protein
MSEDTGAHEANGCTLEIVTGARIEISLTPDEFLKLALDEEGHLRRGFFQVPVPETSRNDDFYRNRRWVKAAQVVAIYPLDAKPDGYAVSIPMTQAEAALSR